MKQLSKKNLFFGQLVATIPGFKRQLMFQM